MNKQFFLILIFALSTINVSAQKNSVIQGKLLNNNGLSKVYMQDLMTKKYIDSATIDATNRFKFDFHIDKAGFYMLEFETSKSLFLIVEPNDKLTVEFDLQDELNPKIEGAESSKIIYEINKKSAEYDADIERFKKEIQRKKKEYIKKTISENLGSLASVLLIGNLDYNEDKDLIEALDRELYKKYPENAMVQELHQTLSGSGQNAQLNIGDKAPEIDLPNPEGKNIKLSSLRGKYVLVDFWASWCGPCRRESPNLVKLYQKYKSKGLEIYSVSLDKSESAWKRAIKNDKLDSWIHVSDLQYWNSAAAKLYHIKGIPNTVLLNKEGIIIAKGLRGEELADKLAEIFK